MEILGDLNDYKLREELARREESKIARISRERKSPEYYQFWTAMQEIANGFKDPRVLPGFRWITFQEYILHSAHRSNDQKLITMHLDVDLTDVNKRGQFPFYPRAILARQGRFAGMGVGYMEAPMHETRENWYTVYQHSDYDKPLHQRMARTIKAFEWKLCDHNHVSKTTGNCQRQYTCSICGSFYDEDSSG
jgi:hypothetical protein